MSESICQNLSEVKTRIRIACESSGRSPEDITLVAVSKTKPVEDIRDALACGQLQFGENRARELQEKMEIVESMDAIWHYVGPMQTNKIKYMTDRVDWIHSVYKKKYLDEIESRAASAGRHINVLLQVNISREDQKQGCSASDIPELLNHAKEMEHLTIRGLMGMATYTSNPEDVRGEFRLLSDLLKKNQQLNSQSIQLDQLSMGMTNDMEVAIEEGATIVRVGTAIFGERNYNV